MKIFATLAVLLFSFACQAGVGIPEYSACRSWIESHCRTNGLVSAQCVFVGHDSSPLYARMIPLSAGGTVKDVIDRTPFKKATVTIFIMHQSPRETEPWGEFVTVKPAETPAFSLRPSDVLWIWIYEGKVSATTSIIPSAAAALFLIGGAAWAFWHRRRNSPNAALARKKFSAFPRGVWASYLGGGNDMLIGIRLKFEPGGKGLVEMWGFDQLHDPTYVVEPEFKWRSLGERQIEITYRGQTRPVRYDFKVTVNEYRIKELRLFEIGREPDEYGDIGFWLSPFSLVERRP